MSDEKIDLNQAGVEELAALPGIGKKLGARIIEHRDKVGPFASVSELANVSGLSRQKVANIEDRLMVEPQATPEEGAGREESPALEPPMEEVPAGQGIGAEAGAVPLESVTPPEPALEEVPEMELEVEVEPEPAPEVEKQPEAETELGEEPEAELEEPAESEVITGRSLEEEIILSIEPELEFPVEEEEAAAIIEDETGAPSAPEPPVKLDDGEPEPAVAAEPVEEPAGVVPPTRQVVEQAYARTGCFISALAGALLGAILALAILLVANGTLLFAGDARANSLQREFEQEIDTLGQTLDQLDSELRDEIQTFNGQIATVTAMQAAAAETLDQAQSDLSTMQEKLIEAEKVLAAQEEKVSALEETVAGLDERLATVAESAENFDTFLDNLRDLLLRLQGPPPSPTATPTSTVRATPFGTNTPKPTLTAVPTRTPRPSATPLALPQPTRQ